MPSTPTDNQPTSATIWADRINQAYYGELGDEAGRKARDRINWMCAQAQGETVLDIGCSQGITTLLLAREGFKATGIDISETAIDYARAEQEKEVPSVRERIEFICTDLAGLDRQRQFDTVILGEVLEHQTHTTRFLQLAIANVKKGGTLVVTVPFGLHPWPDHKATIYPRELVDVLASEFSIGTLEVRDGYIRLVSRKDGGSAANATEAVVRTTEAGSHEVQEKFYELQTKNSAVTRKSNELKKALDERTKQLSAMQTARDALTNEQVILQGKIVHLESTLATAIEARTAIEQAHATGLARLQADLSAVISQRTTLESKLNAAQESRQALERDMFAQVKQLQDELARGHTQRTAIEKQMAEVTQSLNAQLRDGQARVTALEEQLVQARTRHAELEAQLIQARAGQAGLETQLAQTTQALDSQVRDTEVRVAALEKQLVQADTYRADLEARLGQAEQALESEVRNTQSQVMALEAQLAQAQAQRIEFETQLSHAAEKLGATEKDLQSQVTHLQAQLEQSTSARDAIQASLNDALRSLNDNKLDSTAEIEALRAELVQAIAHRTGLETQLTAVQQSHMEHDANTTARIQNLQRDLASAQSQRDELSAKLAQSRDTASAEASTRVAEMRALRSAITDAEKISAVARENERRAEAKIAALEKRIERDTEIMTRKQAALEMSAMAVRKTLSFQLGNLLIGGFKSPRAFIKLPSALMALRAEAQKRRAERRDKTGEPMHALKVEAKAKNSTTEIDFETLLNHFNKGGISGVAAVLEECKTKNHEQASAFTQLARHLQSILPEKAAEAAREAYQRDPQPYRAKWLAFRLFEAGYISEPAELLASLPGTPAELSVSEQRRAEEIAALTRLREERPVLMTRQEPAYEAVSGSLLYVAASAMPYHTSGYTVRTHELVRALSDAGLDVTVLTRPGYPWDRHDSKGEPSGQETVIDGIVYSHSKQPSQALPLDVYFDEAARVIAEAAAARRVQAIHAASNHVNALPALIAARRLGIPFIYEMRGVWELSRASKVPNYETSERFQLGLDLEAFVATNADRVYVISNALGEFIQGWGLDRTKLALLPNCVNEDTIGKAAVKPANKIAGTFTVGYAGAMVGYEGLDVLIDAIAQLKVRGARVHARLIGDGDMRPALEALVSERGVSDQIEFLGKLKPDAARAQLAATNAVAIPRKAHHVCEIIPPIKLVEAMALGMPVIVPNLQVFCEEVKANETGILFKAGDAVDLANALERLMKDPQLAADLGARAQAASKERVWGPFAKKISTDLKNANFDELYRVGGYQAIIDYVSATFSGRAKAGAQELLRASKYLEGRGDATAEYSLARAALALDRSEGTLRNAFWAVSRANDFDLVREIIRQLETMYSRTSNAKQQQALAKMKTVPAYLLSIVEAARPGSGPQIESIPNRLCYILHNTLPYSSGGYATRSHGVATGMREAGWDVVVLSRPGFPVDTKPELIDTDLPMVDTVEGIPYVRTLEPSRLKSKGNAYILAAADALEARFREFRPAAVMAASNNITAIPALLAARRLGIPFMYEIRGFWEITRLSRESEYGDTPQFRLQSMLEAAAAKAADHAFTLTEPMREELVERGVPLAQIDLLPNSCDPTRFEPVARDEVLAAKLGIPAGVPVIGYIGTFVEYEGLEYLAEACALLKQQGLEFRLLMVGNENTSDQSRGPITEQIIQVAEKNGFTDWLILTGRIPHEQVEAHYSLVDIAPFPRKPLPVCEMVSPMKPLEALAMEKAVIVSSVRALVEMIQDGKTGLVFEKGNVSSLAATLKRLIETPELRTELGINGRKWVERERTWALVGEKAGAIMTRIIVERDAGAA